MDGLPDVLISDIGMPDEDGYELIARCVDFQNRKVGECPRLPLTGYATKKDRERALAAAISYTWPNREQADLIALLPI